MPWHIRAVSSANFGLYICSYESVEFHPPSISCRRTYTANNYQEFLLDASCARLTLIVTLWKSYWVCLSTKKPPAIRNLCKEGSGSTHYQRLAIAWNSSWLMFFSYHLSPTWIILCEFLVIRNRNTHSFSTHLSVVFAPPAFSRDDSSVYCLSPVSLIHPLAPIDKQSDSNGCDFLCSTSARCNHTRHRNRQTGRGPMYKHALPLT